jgi:NAD(P)-dependent dehydrogenase (short-subunit alcohol dehydrogenase family)
MGFLNKTVIITGSGNGIGKGIALLYAKKSANVVIADIDKTAGSKQYLHQYNKYKIHHRYRNDRQYMRDHNHRCSCPGFPAERPGINYCIKA